MSHPGGRYKGLSKAMFYEARRLYRGLREVGWSPPAGLDPARSARRSAAARRRADARGRVVIPRGYFDAPPCLVKRRKRTDGKGRGRSAWQGRLGTLVRS